MRALTASARYITYGLFGRIGLSWRRDLIVGRTPASVLVGSAWQWAPAFRTQNEVHTPIVTDKG